MKRRRRKACFFVNVFGMRALHDAVSHKGTPGSIERLPKYPRGLKTASRRAKTRSIFGQDSFESVEHHPRLPNPAQHGPSNSPRQPRTVPQLLLREEWWNKAASGFPKGPRRLQDFALSPSLSLSLSPHPMKLLLTMMLMICSFSRHCYTCKIKYSYSAQRMS